MATAPHGHGPGRVFQEIYTVQSGLPLFPATHQDKPFAFRFLEGILDSTDSCEVLGEKQKNSLSR